MSSDLSSDVMEQQSEQQSFRQCPKCGKAFPQAMPASEQCPACGIYFFKWGQAPQLHVTETSNDENMLQTLLQPKPDLDTTSFYGRCVALLMLSWWSWSLIRADYRDGEIFDSFMHNILLPIHEAGHVFLMPFGEFMTILGGSLFQLALPFGIAVAFVVKQRDNFGAAIALWWTSVSLLDLSPYIYDALHPQLIMLGGHTGEDGPHDWIYLLGVFGQIPRSQHWGTLAHTFGTLFVVVTLLWAAVILLKQKDRLDEFA